MTKKISIFKGNLSFRLAVAAGVLATCLIAPLNATPADDIAAHNYLVALVNTPGALVSLYNLTGTLLPSDRPLSGEETYFLYTQLFKSDGVTHSVAYDNPVGAAQALGPGDRYLSALRTTTGALTALTHLTGTVFPPSGYLKGPDMDLLFMQLFDPAEPGGKTAAYSDPIGTANALVPAENYLDALRKTGASQVIETMTGQTLPPTGTYGTSGQLKFLFSQLFDQNRQPTRAYTDPSTAASAWFNAQAYLQAIRSVPGAASTLGIFTTFDFSGSRQLSPAQVQALFGQLYDAEGSETLAFKSPSQAAQNLASAGLYLSSLKSTPGAMQALQIFMNGPLPSGRAWSQAEVDGFFHLLFDATGKPTVAVTNPTQAARDMAAAGAYLAALQNTPGAMQALQTFLHSTLPTGIWSQQDVDNFFKLLFDSKGAPTLAYTDPPLAAKHLAHAGDYLQFITKSPDATHALETFLGLSLPKDRAWTQGEVESFFTQLFDALNQPTLAYTQPALAAQHMAAAGALLTALDNNKSALKALEKFLGKPLATDRKWTMSEIDSFFNLLFDANRQPTLAYNEPVKAADALAHAWAFLDALNHNSAGLKALERFMGKSLPNGRAWTESEIVDFFHQLYTSDGNPSLAYTNPNKAVDNLAHAWAYLEALRNKPGAIRMLETFLGKSLPTGRVWTQDEIETLFTLLFDSEGKETLAYTDPTKAADYMLHAAAYFSELKMDAGALTMLETFLGRSLPAGRAWSQAEIESFFTLLFDKDGNTTLAFNDPHTAAQHMNHAHTYLDKLRTTPGALAALQMFMNVGLPVNRAWSQDEIDFFFQLLFDVARNPTLAYTDPGKAALNMAAAGNYLVALRTTPGASEALYQLTGMRLPEGRAWTQEEVEDFFKLLFDKDGNETLAYTEPGKAAEYLVHAAAFLEALRNTPGALAGLEKASGGRTLPASGPLSPDDIDFLFRKLFDANSQPTDAFTDPWKAASDLAKLVEKPSWLPKAGLILLGAAVGWGVFLNGFGSLGSTVGVLGLAAAGGLMVLLGGKPKHGDVNNPPPTSSLSAPHLAPVAEPSPAHSLPDSVTPPDFTFPKGIVSPELHVSGDLPPNINYRPLLLPGNGDRMVADPAAAQASWDQFRWLATSELDDRSVLQRRRAIEKAAASNKKVNSSGL